MAKRSWPFGVTSWDDTVKFAQLLFAVDVAFENYAEKLSHRSSIEGACAEGRPFFEIGDFIASQLEEIFQLWRNET